MGPDKEGAGRMWNSIVVVLLLVAVAAHLYVGWLDERRLVLRIGGHLSLYVLAVWAAVLCAACAGLVAKKGRSLFMIGTAILSGVVLAVVWTS